jgi:hypothetical protein
MSFSVHLSLLSDIFSCFQEGRTLSTLPSAELEQAHTNPHKAIFDLTHQLHVVRAHLLHYESLLNDFKKTVSFLWHVMNPGTDVTRAGIGVGLGGVLPSMGTYDRFKHARGWGGRKPRSRSRVRARNNSPVPAGSSGPRRGPVRPARVTRGETVATEFPTGSKLGATLSAKPDKGKQRAATIGTSRPPSPSRGAGSSRASLSLQIPYSASRPSSPTRAASPLMRLKRSRSALYSPANDPEDESIDGGILAEVFDPDYDIGELEVDDDDDDEDGEDEIMADDVAFTIESDEEGGVKGLKQLTPDYSQTPSASETATTELDAEALAEEMERFREIQNREFRSLLRKETRTLLTEIERLEMTRRMLDRRLGNVMNLAFSSINIEDSNRMKKLAEASIRDSQGLSLHA